MMSARVFISSRQRSPEEIQATQEIEKFLRDRGYEPYVAANEQMSRDVNFNILQKIQDYEYFLIVNFRSFSTYVFQELAIARFLDKKLMVFQEQGTVKKNRIEKQGVGYAMQLNPVEFNGMEDLLQKAEWLLNQKEQTGEWDKSHRDELSMEQSNFEAIQPNPNWPFRFYNIRVRNNSRFTHARSCTAYISSVVKLTEDIETQVRGHVADLKWAGLALPNAELYRNGHVRDFTAVCIHKDLPSIGCMYQAVDNHEIPLQLIEGPGKFRLTYHVISDNFPEIKCMAYLSLGNTVTDFRFSMED